MKSMEVFFDDGSVVIVSTGVSLEEFSKHYMGKYFQFDLEKTEQKSVKCIGVKEMKENQMSKINLGRISGFSFIPKDDENPAIIVCKFVESKDTKPLEIEFTKGAYLYMEVEEPYELEGL